MADKYLLAIPIHLIAHNTLSGGPILPSQIKQTMQQKKLGTSTRLGMSHIYIERRTLHGTGVSVLAHDLAHHAYMRQFEGQIIVVADKPFSLLRVTRKHWLQLITAVQRERARTLVSARIAELSHQLSHMKTLRFIAKPPQEAPSGQVLFVTSEEIEGQELSCRTLYVTCQLTPAKMQKITSALLRNALLVEYCRKEKN